ncbi:MAG: transcription elongation factor GreA [Lachnospiraceae bacterium]|nr:transcription elongation factor GreA [Lachnospiraceae bacterium]
MYDELTRSDIAKMEEEIEYRKVTLRHELLEHVKEARAQGDLSENFEYYAAKKEKNKNESRIRYLERMIRTAKIIEESSDREAVTLNTKVTIYIPDDEVEETYKIVTTLREDVMAGKISNVSPMGKALMGHKVGDIVTIRVNDNFSYDAQIKGIEQIGEEESDTIKSF